MSSSAPAGSTADRLDDVAAASVRGPLAALALSMLMSSLDASIANAALPVIADAFHASFGHVQWVVLAYLLPLTASIVSAGRLGDGVGRRRLLLGGIATFTVASVACGLAPTLRALLVARAAQGLGAAGMMALAVALIGDIVPKAKAGRAMGLLGTMSAIGTTLGPAVGGLLAARFGWQTIFLVNLPLGVLALMLGYRCLPDDRPGREMRAAGFGAIGSLLLALSLIPYALAMTLGRGHWGGQHVALLALAAASGTAFVLAETRSPAPLIAVALLRTGATNVSLAATALVSTVMMTTLVVGPFHLSRALGLRDALVGLALSAGPLVAAIAGVPAGRLVDRFGSRRMLVAGLIGIAAGAALVSATPSGVGLVGYLGPVAVMTASYAVFQAVNNTRYMAVVTEAHRGVAAGMLSLARNLGLVTGVAAMGAVFAWAAGSGNIVTAPPAAIAAGTRITFGIAAGIGVAAIAAVARCRVVVQRLASGGSALPPTSPMDEMASGRGCR